MSAELEALIEELDLDLDLDELDDVEELDLAEKGLESVPACIFTLTTATTLAQESSPACCLFSSLCFASALSAHRSSLGLHAVRFGCRARGGGGGWRRASVSPSRASCTTARAHGGTLPSMDALSVSAPNLVWHVSPPPTHTHTGHNINF